MAKTTTAKKVTTNANPIESAEAVIAELEEKRSALIATRAKDDRNMGSVAYRAHAHGDSAANDQLDEYVESALRHDQQIKSIDAAIEVAKQKLAEAKSREQAEAERLAATELLALCKVLRQAGQKADDALAVLGEAADELGDVINAINRLGVTHPSSMQLASLGERACRTALRQHPWARAFSDIAPADRRDFSFTSDWARNIEQAVNAKLEQLNKGGGSKAA